MVMEQAFATLAIHADEAQARLQTKDVAAPLSVSTIFRYPPPPGESYDDTPENLAPNVYSRESQPNRDRVETLIGNLEGGHAVTYSSGLAAVHAALVHFRPERVAVRQCYFGTQANFTLFNKIRVLEKIDVDDEFKKGDLVWIESPINPTGEIHDISHYAQKARKAGAVLIVDGTFAPPPLQYPMRLGAHIVFHSATKYLGGHSDLLGGVLIVPTESEATELREDRSVLGNTMGSMETWLLLRSVRTLEIRINRQSQTATALVAWLNRGVKSSVPVDGIPANAIHSLRHVSVQKTSFDKVAQMPGGFGPVFAILLTSRRAAELVAHRLKCFVHATSLGGVESTIEWRLLSDPDTDERLLRASVGLEDLEDLKQDWRQALCSAMETIEKEKGTN